MKKILTIMLLIHSGLVSFAQQGSPCLVKNSNRTKEGFITELFKAENKTLLSEYNLNVNQMVVNLNEDPLQGDEDLKNIIRSASLLKKEDLEKMGIYGIYNGFKKSNGSIAYIPNDPLKEGYVYLVYKGVVFGALNCGNPVLVLPQRRKVQSIKRDTTFIYSEKIIVKTEIQQAVVHDTIYANFQPQVQQQQNCCGTMSAIHPMYNNGYSDNCCGGMRTTNYNNCNSCYQQQVFVPQQVPSFGWGGYVNVSFSNQQQQAPPPQQVYYPNPHPVRNTPQPGGRVTQPSGSSNPGGGRVTQPSGNVNPGGSRVTQPGRR